MRPFSRWSIEWKLPLGGGLLLLAVIVGLTAAAYREVKRGARDVAVQRLTAVSAQLAQLLAAGNLQTTTSAIAANPKVVAFLSSRRPGDSAAAAQALGEVRLTGLNVALEIWDSSARKVLSTTAGPSRSDSITRRIIAALGSDTAGVSELVRLGDSAAYATTRVVGGAQRLGYVVFWRVVAANPAGRDQLNQLIGREAALLIGNRNGAVWTDLSALVDGPDKPITPEAGAVEYRRGGEPRIGMVRPIGNTDWVALVDFRESVVTGPAHAFLLRAAIGSTLLWVVAMVAVWLASRRISGPLRRLTGAVERVSSAETPSKVVLNREDELGRLAQAFNVMADRVGEAQQGLEAKVQERTHELNEALHQLTGSERRLSLAKEAAERANRAKSDFLAKMSHELRTPLNSIIGFSEVLLEQTFGPLNDKQQRYVGNVITSGRQLLDLINDILDLSKVEAGRMELAPAKINLATDLADVRTHVTALADRKKLAIDLAVDPALPAVTADPGKLKQILYNLLSNAIKFTPDGGRITVAAGLADPGTDPHSVRVSVTDTGIGIRPEDHLRIFDEFEQIDSEYARRQQGTGLGLALTRRLVELHGGRIWVESTLDTGSTFHFTLPIDGRADPVPKGPGPNELREAEHAGGPLVLVVEDDASARELLSHHLRSAGYRVVEAASGDEALALATELRPDAITLDILLPGRHGHEVLATLKAQPATADIPVVVVSITEDRELGMSLGASDWLVKPARREDFIASIHRAARGAHPEGPASVLVVDDEPAMLELLSDLLTNQGFSVLAARSGREGIALAHQIRPTVVVLDLIMPDPDGFEVARQIRAMPDGKDIPIVVFSNKELTEEDRVRLHGSVSAIVAKGHGRDALLRELSVLAAPRRNGH